MKQSLLRSTVLMALAWAGAAWADDTKPAADPPTKKVGVAKTTDSSGPPAIEKKKAQGRLPPGYKGVADDAQKAKIYKIEEDYAPRMEALHEQLKQLRAQRDAEVKALLTPEQQKQVKQALAESKVKRGKRNTAATKESAGKDAPAKDSSTKEIGKDAAATKTLSTSGAKPTEPPLTK